jgi:hypothetical protein
MIVDKHGLFAWMLRQIPQGSLDIPTAFACAMLRDEFGVRKAFTLKSQMQGSIDPWLNTFIERVLVPSPTTQWELIATLIPIPDVLDRVPLGLVEKMAVRWIEITKALAGPMEMLWIAGVDQSVAHRACLVPRGVNSTAWNAYAGSWSNARRNIASLFDRLGWRMPPIFKCMKVTAGDQMSWSGEPDENTRVAGDLARSGIRPWSGLTGSHTFDELTQVIVKACVEQNVDPVKWRMDGAAKARSQDLCHHTDMINGCSIAPPSGASSSSAYKLLQALGTFGSHPWGGDDKGVASDVSLSLSEFPYLVYRCVTAIDHARDTFLTEANARVPLQK